MNKLLSISSSRILAAFLVVVLVYSPLFPIFTYAQTIDDRICQRNGGTWNGVSCDMPPTIAVHGDVSAQATSDSGVAVSYVSPATSDDVDAPGTASCTPLSDSTFPAGTTLVTCTATDSAGNSASPVSFNVIVAPYVAPDTTPPAIAPHDDVNALVGGNLL